MWVLALRAEGNDGKDARQSNSNGPFTITLIATVRSISDESTDAEIVPF
jgi:hypothetical protein